MFTSEHLHMAINHLPFLGAGLALIPLMIGLIARHRLTVIAGLAIAVLTGWMTPLVMETGESAYERYEDGPIASYLDPGAKEFLEIHEHRAEAWAKAMYASAVISTLCLLLLLWKPETTRLVAVVAGLFCLASLASGIWIAESGGKIRRPDFRVDPVTGPAETNTDKHDY